MGKAQAREQKRRGDNFPLFCAAMAAGARRSAASIATSAATRPRPRSGTIGRSAS